MKSLQTYIAESMQEVDIEALKNAARRIVHGPDYGNLFLNDNGECLWSGCDGDGSGEDDTWTDEQIQQVLSSVDGIKKVHIEAECSPKEEDGWKKIEH